MVADSERHHTQYAAEKIGGKVCADLDAGGLAAKSLHRPADVAVTGILAERIGAVPIDRVRHEYWQSLYRRNVAGDERARLRAYSGASALSAVCRQQHGVGLR